MSTDDVSSEQPQGGSTAPAPSDAAAPYTRAAALWSALILGLLVLIVLLFFIAQNNQTVSLTFMTWSWSLPLGVAMLLAAVGGGLVSVLVGTARIFQLRRAAKKNLALNR